MSEYKKHLFIVNYILSTWDTGQHKMKERGENIDSAINLKE